MSALTSSSPTVAGSARITNRIGLVLSVALGIADMVAPFAIPAPKPGEAGPPMSVLIICAVLGVITIGAAVVAWRSGSRMAARVVAATRILSAVSTLPAFLGGKVPAGLIVVAAVQVTITLVAVYLVLGRPATHSAVNPG